MGKKKTNTNKVISDMFMKHDGDEVLFKSILDFIRNLYLHKKIVIDGKSSEDFNPNFSLVSVAVPFI